MDLACPYCDLALGYTGFPHTEHDCPFHKACGAKCLNCEAAIADCSFFSSNAEARKCQGFARTLAVAVGMNVTQKTKKTTKTVLSIIMAFGGEALTPAQADGINFNIKRVANYMVPKQLASGKTPIYLARGQNGQLAWFLKPVGKDDLKLSMHSLCQAPKGPDEDEDEDDDDDVDVLANRLQAAGRLGEADSLRQGASPSEVFTLTPPAAPAQDRSSLAADRIKQLLRVGLTLDDAVKIIEEDAAGAPTGLPATRPEAGNRLIPKTRLPLTHQGVWREVVQGKTPLAIATAQFDELRQDVQPRNHATQTYDRDGKKRTMKLSIYPPAAAARVPPYLFGDLCGQWAAELPHVNQSLAQITPPEDLSLVPVLPLDTEPLIAHLKRCLRAYTFETVLTAWEALHRFVVSEHINGTSPPPVWTDSWTLPVFTSELARAAPQTRVGPLPPTSEYCLNWNSRQHKKCNPEPTKGCTLRHACLMCDGAHPLSDCPRRV